MSAQALPVLMYHHVSPNPGLVTVSPETFRAQMSWLARHGYRSAGCDDMASFLAGEPLPAKSVLITFDDGYLDNYVYAHPVLREYGLHAAIFLVTGWIGEGPARAHQGDGATPECPNHRRCMECIATGESDPVMLRWSEVEVLRAAGTFEFHSHTHTHTRWEKEFAEPEAKKDVLAQDLEASRSTLAHRLGTVSDHLCWPRGYYDDDYRQVAAQQGFCHLYTTRKGINTPATAADEIRRVVIKDRVGGWFARRLWLYRNPGVGRLYLRLRGQ